MLPGESGDRVDGVSSNQTTIDDLIRRQEAMQTKLKQLRETVEKLMPNKSKVSYDQQSSYII